MVKTITAKINIGKIYHVNYQTDISNHRDSRVTFKSKYYNLIKKPNKDSLKQIFFAQLYF